MSCRPNKLAIVPLAAAAVAALLALPGTAASTCAPSGGVGTDSSSCPAGRPYVNPLKRGSWLPGRIDMGVDLVPQRRQPVVAIGDAKVLGSDSQSGWPGGHF